MRIAAPLSVVLFRQSEMPEWDHPAGFNVIQVGILETLSVGIGIIENPLSIRRIGAMAILGHHVLSYLINPSFATILEEIKTVSSPEGIGKCEDVLLVPPDEMRRQAVVVYDSHVASIGLGGQHVRLPSMLPFPPMEKLDPRSICIKQQMIEPVFGILHAG